MLKNNTIIHNDEFIISVNDDLEIIQKSDGLRFGTDALLLSAYVKKISSGKAADLGAGSGIISMLCAKRKKFAHIYAIEIQPDFADIISRNIELNGLSDRMSSICADVSKLSELDSGTLDVIFTNPPYMKVDSGKRNNSDCKYIARHEICGGISIFCAAASRLLKFGGLFYAVYRPDRMSELICSMCENGIEPKRMTMVAQSPEHEPSLVLVCGKRGANPGMMLTKTLFLADANGDDSVDMKYILENGDFNERYKNL